jgi:hypothetical protein
MSQVSCSSYSQPLSLDFFDSPSCGGWHSQDDSELDELLPLQLQAAALATNSGISLEIRVSSSDGRLRNHCVKLLLPCFASHSPQQQRYLIQH